MASEVRHEPEKSRYTLWVDDEFVGLADYIERSHEVVFTHTEIDPHHRREDLSTTLVQGSLDDARTRFGGTIVAACPFVAEFVDAHPDYQDLIAPRL